MPTIDHHAPLRVLAAVRGHPFDRNALAALFDGMEGISVTFVDQPAAALLMRPGLGASFDALLLYDMPGIDFAPGNMGAKVGPDDALREGLTALLDEGIGVVALHHALAGWPGWPGYSELLGGRFLYRPDELRGQPTLDSGYRHAVDYTAHVLAGDHPVMAGVPATFAMKDELYLGEVFGDSVTPLLRSDYAFVRDNFHSATEAMEGRMFSNEGWNHAPGSDLIGWVKPARNSPLVYLQPGDDEVTYQNAHYRRMVENALRWVVTPEAKAWARGG
ncbi:MULTISPECIES: ThuA domain-containing protein [Novosphingobium]|uniref:ThuA domain-containing protein n=1 Tax=Novosphingobium TaxID=165696 RepID=UPI001CD34272|nr:ThuA domain-containing protein [Novosphingobium percolationis]